LPAISQLLDGGNKMDITLSDTTKSAYDVTELFDMNNIYQDDYSFNAPFWQNIVHLTENYCNYKFPYPSLEGQLWYDSDNKSLNIADTDDASSWTQVVSADKVYVNNYLNVYSANKVESLTLLDDSDISTIYTGDNKNSDNAVTKKYVDNFNGGIVTGTNDICHWVIYPNKYIIIHGLTSGNITIPVEMKDTNYVVVTTNNNNANKIYSITNKTTTTFTVDGNAWMLVGWTK
jgi:hypothetical protein